MSQRFVLSDTCATINPSLLAIREKGFDLRVVCSKQKNGEVYCNYLAFNDHCHFAASTAPELLGLVHLWELYGTDWNRQEPDILGEVIVNEDDNESE